MSADPWDMPPSSNIDARSDPEKGNVMSSESAPSAPGPVRTEDQQTAPSSTELLDPKTWPLSRKLSVLICTSLLGFVSPMASSVISPGLPLIAEAFHITDETRLTFTLSIYMLGYALGQLLFNPLSEVIGRLVVQHVSTLLFLLFNIGTAVAQTEAQFLVLRFFAGFFGSGLLSIGGSMVADMFVPAHRGKAMALFSMGVSMGPIVGPIVSGFVAEYLGFRWILWILVFTTTLTFALSLVFLRETYYPIVQLRQQKIHGPTWIRVFAHRFMPCALSIPPKELMTNVATSFIRDYHMKSSIAGLNYISLGVGIMTGIFVTGYFCDKIYHQLRMKYGKVVDGNDSPEALKGVPEHRLPLLIPSLILVPIGLVVYGWPAEKHVHWIVPDIGLAIYGIGFMASFMVIQVYVLDAFEFPASALGAANLLRCLFGGVLPLAAPSLFDSLGHGWGCTTLALIATAFVIPSTILLMRYGAALRGRKSHKAQCLAVMGQNLILNMNDKDKGFKVVAYNRTTSKVDDFLENEAKGTNVIGAHSIEEFVALLKRPRKVILLVKAGAAVDAFIEQLLPHLEEGDIIIDGGNSHFPDTNRRCQEIEAKGLLYVGSGVSGGEEGARHGPSLMPGGSEAAWPHIKEIFQKTAAQSDGEPCCDWVGTGGSGHYVKMVHNGIEYGDMQLIAEAYWLLKQGLGMNEKEIGEIFATWNKGVLDSFLIEITSEILAYNDQDGEPMLTKILDSAGQKGTGKWTAINALELGQPVTLIGEAVFARCLSSLKGERSRASKILAGPKPRPFEGNKQQFIDDLEQALYASKIVSYAQGFMLMREAAKDYNWKLNNPSIALMWRGGCIIRSVFLKDITSAFRKNPELENLLFDDFFSSAIKKAEDGWRRVVAQAVLWGVPTPVFSSALAFFDGIRSELLPASLLQAQRDYFGAHTFRVLPGKENDHLKEGEDIHVNWTGRGGKVSASTYHL
ncbi:hypothetical protein MEQU1_002682 [Malassezia equina]|uniref:6-phosphogluconate dehydrogenase, decarboxylating n=1 Tax=Malassezia equina TaxID=1381935 RepID=A0AAF0EE56_9BASI|nr:hypothetical protein MEQU1_002682 [Malassezia equina]